MHSKRLFSKLRHQLKKRYVAGYVSLKQRHYYPCANVQEAWLMSTNNAFWIGSALKCRKMMRHWFHSAKYAGHHIQQGFALAVGNSVLKD